MTGPAVVSACLIGVKCRYDGNHSLNEAVISALENINIVPLCPEQLGGLSTPRPPSEIEAGDGMDVLHNDSRVINSLGEDITSSFIRGAHEALKIVKLSGAKKAYLKEKSPSCGVRNIKKKGEVFEGRGIFAALLEKNGIETVGY